MTTIYSKLPSVIEFKNKKIELDLAFNNVLKFIDLQEEQAFTIGEKLHLALNLLIKDIKQISNFNTNDKIDLLNKIVNNYIKFETKQIKGQKVFDIKKDSIYIYSSFIKDYNINLFEVQGKLQWFEFVSLLQGLSKETKLAQVIEIRSKKVPKPTKYNKEEIAQLNKLKNIYALEEGDLQEGIKNLFKNLKGGGKIGGR